MYGLHTCVLLLLPQVATQELIRAGGKKEGIWETERGAGYQNCRRGEERNLYFAHRTQSVSELLLSQCRGCTWAQKISNSIVIPIGIWWIPYPFSSSIQINCAWGEEERGEARKEGEGCGFWLLLPPFSMGALWCVKIRGFSPHPFLPYIAFLEFLNA